jgi:hypothetical protein
MTYSVLHLLFAPRLTGAFLCAKTSRQAPSDRRPPTFGAAAIDIRRKRHNTFFCAGANGPLTQPIAAMFIFHWVPSVNIACHDHEGSAIWKPISATQMVVTVNKN